MTSLVITLNAPEESVGAKTKDAPGLQVRFSVMDDILSDGIDLLMEMRGGTKQARQNIVEFMVERYKATYKVTRDREESWCANMCLIDVQAARANPLFDAVIAQRAWSERFITMYENGVMNLRLDFPSTLPDDKQQLVANILVGTAKLADENATSFLGHVGDTDDDWRLAIEKSTQ